MSLYEKLQQATSEEDVKDAYKTLSEKLQPQVYELGFLKH
jgi:hypothetical protein